MADEVKYSTLGDLRNSSELHREIEFLLHDPTDMRLTLREIPFGSIASAAMKIGQMKPDDVMAAPGENVAGSNVNVTDDSYSLTIAGYRLVREVSDLVQITSNGEGVINIETLAGLMKDSANATLQTMICATFPGFSNSVGSTGVDLDVDDIYDAQFLLTANLASGQASCVLYPEQWNNFQASLRGESGASAFSPATNEMLAFKGSGYKGSWNGIEFYVSDKVTAVNANADSNGAMYTQQALSYTEAPIASQLAGYMPKASQVDGLKVLVEFDRKAAEGATLVVGHYYPAVAEAQDGAGVAIITDR
jgi:hypothetical protein